MGTLHGGDRFTWKSHSIAGVVNYHYMYFNSKFCYLRIQLSNDRWLIAFNPQAHPDNHGFPDQGAGAWTSLGHVPFPSFPERDQSLPIAKEQCIIHFDHLLANNQLLEETK